MIDSKLNDINTFLSFSVLRSKYWSSAQKRYHEVFCDVRA